MNAAKESPQAITMPAELKKDIKRLAAEEMRPMIWFLRRLIDDEMERRTQSAES